MLRPGGCPILSARELWARRVGIFALEHVLYGINANFAVFSGFVKGKTAPGPFARIRNKVAFHRIHVHVRELLDFLFLTPDIEIVEAPFPELRKSRSRRLMAEPHLAGGFLLQHLQHDGGSFCGRLANQKMHVLRHDDVSGKRKTETVANQVERFDEEIS